ncbi:DUF5985 family protein [Myxococcota bacterium]|nr:DUF5985 family protein [Myxococcota bacterium]
MVEAVYLACALSCVVCAVLLARGFSRTRQRLLLWSALGFTGLAVNNVLLVVDLVVLPNGVDLSIARLVSAAIALTIMVLGFVAEGP